MAARVEVRVFTRADQILLHAPAWDELIGLMPRPSPFLLTRWVVPWWEAYGDPSRELAVLAAFRDDRLVGLLPLVVRSLRGVRVAGFMGEEQSALCDIALAPGESDETARALLARCRLIGFDVANLFGLPLGSILARVAGSRAHVIERVPAPVIAVHETFAELYRRVYKSERRREHAKKRRRLERLGALTFETAATAAAVSVVLPDAQRIFLARRADLLDGSHFVTPIGRRFHERTLVELAGDGRVRLVTARLDGRPIAFYLYLLVGGSAVAHALGHLPHYGRHSIGMLTMFEALRSAIDEDRVKRFEFLGGDEPYKRSLTTSREPLMQLIGLAESRRGRVLERVILRGVQGRVWMRDRELARRLYVRVAVPLAHRRRRV